MSGNPARFDGSGFTAYTSYMATNERNPMIFLAITQNGYAFTVKSEGSSLKTFQTIVDGTVDMVTTRLTALPLPHPFDVWVNDEGLYRNDFSLNLVASCLTGTSLVGPVVITNGNVRTGATTGLTEADLTFFSTIMHIDNNEGQHYTADEVAYWTKEAA